MICVVDTETTGLDPEKDSVVELAVVVVDPDARGIVDTFEALVAPTSLMGLEARAAHHIRDDMLTHARSLLDVAYTSPLASRDDITHLAAHNAAFDSQFIKTDTPWLCTYRIAMHLWPEAPRHTNSVLRYFLEGLDDELRATALGEEIMCQPPHRALPDAWVTAHILLRQLELRTIEELAELTVQPVLLKTVKFGKHKGEAWADLPKSYLHWIASKDFSPDEIHTALHYIKK